MVTSKQKLEAGHFVPISSIPDGGYFRIANGYYSDKERQSVITGFTYGVKLFHNECRARVRLEGEQVHVVFGEDEARREFDSRGVSETNWPPVVDVIAVSDEQYEQYHAAFTRFTRQGGAIIMDAKVLKALKVKYQFNQGALDKAKAAGKPEAELDAIQQRINLIKQNAIDNGVDPNSLESVDGPATTIKAGGKTHTTKPHAPAKLTKAKAGEKVVKPKKEKKLPATGPCLCCGKGETNGMFLPGHDARTKGLMLKVERGELEESDLPKAIQPLVKFAGSRKTAGKDDSNYRIVQSPVKFPGRPDIKLVDKEGNARAA